MEALGAHAEEVRWAYPDGGTGLRDSFAKTFLKLLSGEVFHRLAV